MSGFYGVGGGDITLLQEETLASAGTITFTNIPQSYRDLHIHLWTPASTGARYADLWLNNDTAANYTGNRGRVSGPNAASWTARASAIVGLNQTVSPAWAEITIPNYRSSAAKTILSRTGAETTAGAWEQDLFIWKWTGTAAVTRIDLQSEGVNLLAGTIATLYGVGRVS